jgi:hypothetical protein
MKTWTCKNLESPACIGPADKNINVAFSGESTLERALTRALKQGSECERDDKKFCNDQIKYMRVGKPGSPVKTRAEAIAKITAPGAWTEEQCKGCFKGELKPSQRPSELQTNHPYASEAGLYEGVQFLDIGGASDRGVLTVQTLQSFFSGGLEKVKDAGFEGVCFDIEMTKGEEELVKEFERAFVACKQAGLLVMITTSHSAPYAASARAKELLIDAWVKSDNIDIFSPQLYTSGFEASPEFMQTPCRSGGGTDQSKCTWERLKRMKAKWVLSLASADHYPAAKAFFDNLGIKTHGYIQWKDPLKPVAEAVNATQSTQAAP